MLYGYGNLLIVILYVLLMSQFVAITFQEFLHSKMCSVRLLYVKHALNVRFKTYV